MSQQPSSKIRLDLDPDGIYVSLLKPGNKIIDDGKESFLWSSKECASTSSHSHHQTPLFPSVQNNMLFSISGNGEEHKSKQKYIRIRRNNDGYKNRFGI